MSGNNRFERSVETLAHPAAHIFQREWQTYCKVVDNNYLFHREAYDRLHGVLIEEFAAPFRFLDVACGDTRATIEALKGTRVARYLGIDLSTAALDIAARALEALGCPADLRQADFVEALRHWREPVDVVWIGLSLHHLRAPEKLQLMRDARRMVGRNGLFVIYENASPDGEDRTNWLRRWDLQEPAWTGFTEDEWRRLAAHVHAADFPETSSRWLELGRDAGFGEVREVFAAPSDLFRMYCFRA